VLALVDDLLVVDRHDRQLEALREKIGVRVEVGEDDLRVEMTDVFHVRRGVLEQHRGRKQHVLHDRRIAVHGAGRVPDGQPSDLDDVGEVALQKLVRAPRHDDLDLVPPRDEVLDDDLRASRMPHALTDDPIKDTHLGRIVSGCTALGCEIVFRP
jgi:hypothetical protein